MSSSTITVKRGNTWFGGTPAFVYGDGSPVVLPDNHKILFTVKSTYDKANNDDAALIKKDFTGIAWSLNENDTDIQEGTYRWDMKIVAPNYEQNSDSGDFVVEKRVGVRDE